MFDPLPDKPDHQQIELGVLELWERTGAFAELQRRNADGPPFSFVDGPVTANKILGVHTAWGRTLKDVFQRYKASRGYRQRYQNGFDCQGLWIEVGVERELGLDSKAEIVDYGLAEFAAKCRDVVRWSSQALTEGSIRLGQWMDWERSYFTFSDTNIEYIWRFLSIVHQRGWLYQGNRPTEWCPRCGTSISAHELAGSYVDREDPSLSVRFSLRDRPGESLVIWTTTPWTLPANVATAVHPEARYGLRRGEWLAVERAGEGPFDEVRTGAELVGWVYRAPFDDIGPGGQVEHRVVAWDEVSLQEGTGLVHIAPGCGAEDFQLGVTNGLPTISPVDEAGRFVAGFGWLTGLSTTEARARIIGDLSRQGLLHAEGTIVHRFPECWRCHTPLIFRLSDDWFIAADPVRDELRQANRRVEWIPAYMGKRMDDWLVTMADWSISRRRYYGLPLPFYPCSCGHLTVVSSRADLLQRAVAPVTDSDLPELHRPWIDAVRIRCEACGEGVERVAEVGDVWLDAGIVPFSTLGWQNPTWVAGGQGTGAAEGLTVADLPDHAYWEEWFPADLVSEMREQIRLWFYSQLFMSVTLTGRAPYRRVLGYEKLLDETGNEMHGSHGNMIDAADAFERMGADVMRWLYAMQPPSQNLLFGSAPARDIQRRLLTLWNSVSFFVQYANIAGFEPRWADLTGGLTGPGAGGVARRSEAGTGAPTGAETGGELQDLDRWVLALTGQLVHDVTAGYERFLTVDVVRAFEAGIDDISNWYIRRSRRRFWDGDPVALRSLWCALVTALRLIAPVMPFLAEHLWQVLVVVPCPEAPRSIFLAGWPELPEVDHQVLDNWSAARSAVELGRRARSQAGIRVRQPLRRMVVQGADQARPLARTIAEELRVDDIVFAEVEATELRIRPNLAKLGPRLGPDLPAVRAALAAGQWEQRGEGSFRVAGHDLDAADLLIDRIPREGWAFASNDEGMLVAIDTGLDDELLLQARANDLVHQVNRLRKERGLELTDRIALTLAAGDADLMAHGEWIAAETLATSVAVGDGDELTIERTSGGPPTGTPPGTAAAGSD